MIVEFNQLPDHARVWIYPSSRKFSEQEVVFITEKISHFITNWTAHEQMLHAGFSIVYDRFIVIAVDTEIHNVTGCSIDKKVHFIQQLEAELKVELLDKMNVTYKSGDFLAHKSLIDFKKMAKERAVTAQTIVFNNLVNTLDEWKTSWEVPASESWHSRFF